MGAVRSDGQKQPVLIAPYRVLVLSGGRIVGDLHSEEEKAPLPAPGHPD